MLVLLTLKFFLAYITKINPKTDKDFYHNILLKDSTKIVISDSSLQHLTARKKESIVIWGETQPEHFGYSFHENLTEKNENTISYFKPFGEINENVIFPKPEKILYHLIKS